MMESWNGSSEGKGLLFSDEMDLQNHAFATGRKTLMDWDNRPPYYFESDGLVPDRDAVEGMELLDLGFSDLERKPFLGNQGVEILSSEVVSGSSKRAASPTCMFTSDLCFDEVPSEVKFSSSPMGTSSQDSSLIDLKLGTLAGCKEAENSKLLEKRLALSPGSPFLPTKRARKTSSYSQSAFCQVHGCNRDLSSSKDYHRRHRVCDVHSKTAKVIVNGIEQRFCQQCSRFHLLGEFDDGKRSCRKRLAGHNERRRKPQLDTHSGTKYVGTSLPKKTPFVFPEILRAGIICAGKNEQANLFRNAKLEGELMNSSFQSATSETRGHLFPKSFFHLDGTGKQRWSEHSSSGDEDCTFTASTYHVLSGASTPNRALSLLSAQSEDLSSHLTGHPRAGLQIMQGHSSNHVVPQTQKRLHVSSVEQWGSNGLHSHGINSMGADKIGSRVLPDASHAADFQVLTDGILQESDIMGANCFRSSEDGPTIDWLQLSSHLQRVERHRNSIRVKQENEDPCCLPTFRAVCNQQE